MTVASTTTKVSYSGNGSTTVFTVPFYFLAVADLRVILRTGTTETVQTLTSQYTVTGAGVASGGTVTMLTAPASGTTLTILRNVSPTQETDLLPNDRLPAESLETALDKATMLIQQLDEVADRALQFPASDAAVSAQIPAASARASKFLSFDASGTPVATIGTDATTATFLQFGTGAVTRSVNDKLRDFVSVKDFGAVGDGLTNDRNAIQSAFNASKSVYFPAGTYYLGAYSTAANIIDLSALGAGISVHCDNNVELVVQTTASVMPRVFYLLNNNNFSCDPIRIRDTGYDSSLTWKGAMGFYLDCGASDNWGDVKLSAVYAKTMVAGVTVAGGNASNRVRGIRIGQLFSDDCYYGFNAQNNGDGVVIDNLIAFQNYRPYFVYGVTDHRVKIFNRNNRSTSGAVNISRSPGGLNTSGIDVTYVARDQTQNITHVLINHIDLLGGEISNVRVNIDIRSSVIYTPLRFVNYTGLGGSETSGASSNLVYDIVVSGSCDVQANPITSVAAYGAKRALTFVAGQHFFYDTTIPSLFYLDRAARGLAVTWTASVTNPVIGNGSISGAYDLAGGVCTYSVALTAGSTTTFGSGDWSFSAPFAAAIASVGSVWVFDSGTAYYIGTCLMNAGASTIQCYAAGATSGYRSTSPMTWANGDQLQLTISYPIS